MIPRPIMFHQLARPLATFLHASWFLLSRSAHSRLNHDRFRQWFCKFVVSLHQPLVNFGSSTFHSRNHRPSFRNKPFVHRTFISLDDSAPETAHSKFSKAKKEMKAFLAYIEAIQGEATLLLNSLLLQHRENLAMLQLMETQAALRDVSLHGKNMTM